VTTHILFLSTLFSGIPKSNYFYRYYEVGNNKHAGRLNVENENSGEEGGMGDRNILG
jgi:hypothetical protein